MIFGVHAMVYSKDADATRAFFRDVLGFTSVDAGHGWLIFALPPAESGVHPLDEDTASEPFHQLSLMCDDINATVAELTRKGVKITRPASDQGWGVMAAIEVPGAGEMGLYQPRHPTAIKSPAPKK